MDGTAEHRARGGFRSHEAGSVIVGWLVRVVIVVGLCGTVTVDLVSIGVAHLQAADDAQTVAADAERVMLSVRAGPGSDEVIRQRVRDAAVADGVSLRGTAVVVNPDGSVTCTVVRQARTLLFASLPVVGSWTQATSTDTAPAIHN